MSAGALARGIGFAEKAEIRTCAAALGARMRAEDGVATAILAIERIMARRDAIV
jgi:sterol 3beta-glucosyltransferase